jgi:preprotein translocase subunit SecA
MLSIFFKKIFGSKNEREIKRLRAAVDTIKQFETQLNALSDQQLQQQTPKLKALLESGKSLDDILPEAFATVREVSKRQLNMRHFDSQMMGGMVLHQGRIAEMRTGEGKTLVATLPAYLNALSGKGVHVITVNDYLAARDANWMRPIYEFLGLSIGIVISGQSPQEKHAAYACDITYGTNNEFGFDFLRDNMALQLDDRVQRGQVFAIIDEVDSILIDEARTPLIISGPSEDKSSLYKRINQLIPVLQEAGKTAEGSKFYEIDEKNRQIELTEDGHEYLENLLTERGILPEGDSLYAANHLALLHHVNAALKAHLLYQKDVQYIVQQGEVIIVDEHTGRILPGRRWSDGIHQAVEAKERVNIRNENQTLASTTFQNYFRLYKKLSGMTGTADTEAYEFHQIYNLDVVVMPTHLPMVRIDKDDLVYLTQADKFNAIIEEIQEIIKKQAPVLVGTASIESSEHLSFLLKKAKIAHQVLNAKYHEREAEIIAQAGQPARVTIATNMAGRGTDILLGGNWKAEVDKLKEPTPEQIEAIKQHWQTQRDIVLQAGGLHIIGSERHESRRIDNQLRGRAGRQGDPGYTRFYLSLEDDLMRIFASDRMRAIMQSLGLKGGEAIEHSMVSKSIANAQKKVEGRNFDIRKSLLEYDDVANDQRRVIYEQRRDILESETISDMITQLREDVVNDMVDQYLPPQTIEDAWEIDGLEKTLANEFHLPLPIKDWLETDKTLQAEDIKKRLQQAFADHYQQKTQQTPEPGVFVQLEKHFMLQELDRLWKEHLANMDFLRQGIHFRGYAQKNPKQEYKREAFEMFRDMLNSLKVSVIQMLMIVEIRRTEEVQALEAEQQALATTLQKQAIAQHPSPNMGSVDAGAPFLQQDRDQDDDQRAAPEPFQREQAKIGRNENCPCGSGKKFKHCHGALD